MLIYRQKLITILTDEMNEHHSSATAIISSQSLKHSISNNMKFSTNLLIYINSNISINGLESFNKHYTFLDVNIGNHVYFRSFLQFI